MCLKLQLFTFLLYKYLAKVIDASFCLSYKQTPFFHDMLWYLIIVKSYCLYHVYQFSLTWDI